MIYAEGFRAFYSAILGDWDTAFAAMERCLAQAVAFDALPQVTAHTSPLFADLPYNKITQDRGMGERMRELFGERYPWPEGFQLDERFAEIIGKPEI